MWKSRTKKGFSLIETVCSVILFSVLFLSASTIALASLKIKASGKEMSEMAEFLEIVKNSLKYNASYEDINLLKANNKLYINNVNMNYTKLKDEDVLSLFETNKEYYGIRIEVKIEGDIVFKVILKLNNDSRYKTEPLSMEFYKGSYR